jgi:hypothetical protein
LGTLNELPSLSTMLSYLEIFIGQIVGSGNGSSSCEKKENLAEGDG